MNKFRLEDPSKSQHSQQVAEQVIPYLGLVAFPLYPKPSIHLSPLLSPSQELMKEREPHPAFRGTDFVSSCRGL